MKIRCNALSLKFGCLYFDCKTTVNYSSYSYSKMLKLLLGYDPITS